MSGYIVVSPTPYFAVSDKSGAYKIQNVPDGSYTVTAWHEGAKNSTKPVAVAGDSKEFSAGGDCGNVCGCGARKTTFRSRLAAGLRLVRGVAGLRVGSSEFGGTNLSPLNICSYARLYHFLDWLHTLQTESITGTSTSTPTTQASAAPELGPNSVMATATASSKKLLAPISAPGEATLCGTFNLRMSR